MNKKQTLVIVFISDLYIIQAQPSLAATMLQPGFVPSPLD
jgi:hypothetical protein